MPQSCLAIALFVVIAAAGCAGDATRPVDSGSDVAVLGYLYIGETVHSGNAVLVTRVLPLDREYRWQDAAVNDATVLLRVEGSPVADTLRWIRPGHYANSGVVIQERTTYHLTVRIPGRRDITGVTTTPYPFTVHREPVEIPRTMQHSRIGDSHPIVLDCAEREQIFVTDVFCQEDWMRARYVNPFGSHDRPTSYEEYGGDDDPPRHIRTYFRVKHLDREGERYRIGWYGAMMVFYGRQEVQLLSVDENVYNFLHRDQPEENGGIVGGIGVFGSACRRSWQVDVTP